MKRIFILTARVLVSLLCLTAGFAVGIQGIVMWKHWQKQRNDAVITSSKNVRGGSKEHFWKRRMLEKASIPYELEIWGSKSEEQYFIKTIKDFEDSQEVAGK